MSKFKISVIHFRAIPLLVATGVLSACGGGTSDTTPNASEPTATISGTVPGTRIEVFGDNGAYYLAHSTNNGTSQHPFELKVPSGLGLRIVMTTNEGTAEEVVSPIGFRDNTQKVHTRLVLGAGDRVDLGHVPLAMSRAEATGDVDGDGDNDDLNNDGMLDSPFMLDDVHSPLAHADADHDGINDFEDPNHGGYQYSLMEQDPVDHDNDGIPNMFDMDYMPPSGFEDVDKDGLHDNTNDSNPTNTAGSNSRFIDDLNHDGYHEDDKNRDGFHDDDVNRDGFHDDDMNKDGYSDYDLNKDGFHDDDMIKDGTHNTNNHHGNGNPMP